MVNRGYGKGGGGLISHNAIIVYHWKCNYQRHFFGFFPHFFGEKNMCQAYFFNKSRLCLQQKGMHQGYTIGYSKTKNLTVLHSAKMDGEEKKTSFLIITSCQCGCDLSFGGMFHLSVSGWAKMAHVHPTGLGDRMRKKRRGCCCACRLWWRRAKQTREQQFWAVSKSVVICCTAGDEILPSFIRIIYMIVYIYICIYVMYRNENHRVPEFNLLGLGWFFPIPKQRIPKGCWVGAIKKTWAPLMFYFLP